MRYLWPIAYTTLLEAIRGRLLVIAAIAAILGLVLGAFLRQVAITETTAVQAVIIAALLRACAVFLLVAFAVGSLVREWQDNGVELTLSHPMPRWAFVLGRYLGLVAAAVLVAVCMSLPLLTYAPLDRVFDWGLSLSLELALVAAAALFFALTLSSLVPALVTVGAFYVLGRSLDAMRIIAGTAEQSVLLTDRIADMVSSLVAALLPHFDRMTLASWLVEPTPNGALVAVLGQTSIYVALLLGAALFDFHRKNF